MVCSWRSEEEVEKHKKHRHESAIHRTRAHSKRKRNHRNKLAKQAQDLYDRLRSLHFCLHASCWSLVHGIELHADALSLHDAASITSTHVFVDGHHMQMRSSGVHVSQVVFLSQICASVFVARRNSRSDIQKTKQETNVVWSAAATFKTCL